MDKTGPIIIIEDDEDDQQMLKKVFTHLGSQNELIFFGDGEEALGYLTDPAVKPFIIFSDINMPKLSGLELREKIHQNEDLRLKSIPYLIFSTCAEQKAVVDAYSKSVQGFFVKPDHYQELVEVIYTIIEYWKKCVSPNYIE